MCISFSLFLKLRCELYSPVNGRQRKMSSALIWNISLWHGHDIEAGDIEDLDLIPFSSTNLQCNLGQVSYC